MVINGHNYQPSQYANLYVPPPSAVTYYDRPIITTSSYQLHGHHQQCSKEPPHPRSFNMQINAPFQQAQISHLNETPEKYRASSDLSEVTIWVNMQQK